MKYQMNQYRHPWRRRIRQFLRDYCGGPYWLQGPYSLNTVEQCLEYDLAREWVRGNRWRLCAYVSIILCLLTLWLHATGQLGAPLQ